MTETMFATCEEVETGQQCYIERFAGPKPARLDAPKALHLELQVLQQPPTTQTVPHNQNQILSDPATASSSHDTGERS
eukprot:scaffold57667_cov18-Prasinocladus_malaysianus.AAC.1